jgi:hypothetical protein
MLKEKIMVTLKGIKIKEKESGQDRSKIRQSTV